MLCLAVFGDELPAQDGPFQYNQFPAKGRVTMIDMGSDYCIPCRMMTPILEKIEKAYKGKADILFIDVNENKEQAVRFEIRVIPTQIFFDDQAKEVYRHEGFLSEEEIISRLSAMGVK
jgi:thioredoxin 1